MTIPALATPNWTRRRWLAISGLLAAGLGAGAGGSSANAAGPKPAAAAKDAPSDHEPINVAVVLGFYNTLIDFAGPWEVLSSSRRFNVYSVSDTRAPVICDDGRSSDASQTPISGLTVIPDFTFDDAPQPRITLVGGQGERDATQAQVNARKYEWIRHAAQKADLTASVCVGAFELGAAGLLNGHSATTNRNAYDRFEKTFPKVNLVRGVRFVESGAVSTATGLTAGIDLALRITERFCGHDVAQRMANYEEWTSTAWNIA
ncbi:MAG: Transcriptional regulator, AraC family [Caulobacteraceae bacterium]|jgi:transcriptional regulator GlxA family with amidase domain|nr:Transcriptional regulator, AraC family [Caulobacteraceae bacterium]